MTSGGSARERAEELRAQAAAARAHAVELEREAGAWQAGAEGEDRVAAALRHLPGGCRVLHDRLLHPTTSGVNLDHLAVTPAGIFLIDAKNWAGNVTVYEGNVWQHTSAPGRGASSAPKHRELLKVAWAAGEMEKVLGHPVIPVLALAGNRTARFEPVRVRGVEVVPLSALVRWLASRHGQLTSGDVDRLALRAGLAFPEATGHIYRAEPTASAMPRREPRTGPRRARRTPPHRKVARPRVKLRRMALAVGALLFLFWGTGMVLGAVQVLSSSTTGEAVVKGVERTRNGKGAVPGSDDGLRAGEKPCDALTPTAIKKILGVRPLAKTLANSDMCGWYLTEPASPYSVPELWITTGASAKLQAVNVAKTTITATGGTAAITVPQNSRVRPSLPASPKVSVPFTISVRYSYPRALTMRRVKAADTAGAKTVTALAAALASGLQHKQPVTKVSAGAR
jgi:hypothetical protein